MRSLIHCIDTSDTFLCISHCSVLLVWHFQEQRNTSKAEQKCVETQQRRNYSAMRIIKIQLFWYIFTKIKTKLPKNAFASMQHASYVLAVRDKSTERMKTTLFDARTKENHSFGARFTFMKICPKQKPSTETEKKIRRLSKTNRKHFIRCTIIKCVHAIIVWPSYLLQWVCNCNYRGRTLLFAPAREREKTQLQL